MAFVPVPKDLNRVKTKVMFNLTKRQLVCFSIAAAVGVPIFFLAKAHLDLSTAAMLMVVIMLPFIFFALYEKDGQPAEKYLYHIVQSMFIRDKVRPYRVPYDYYICNVKLENFNLSHVPVYIMSQEQLSMYATYMSVLGNREDLFGDSPYVDKYIINPPADYDVNPEYLNDEKFATLITEAEKYLGYPYVWGGSNPDTSFDCSGFVSFVLTNSGLVNTGRLGAQGLYNVCTPVSKANAQPGDLIFFVGTYDTPGVSHVGIYVGDGVMIHCGDPIQYTSINSSYWQQHFYAFGRPAY